MIRIIKQKRGPHCGGRGGEREGGCGETIRGKMRGNFFFLFFPLIGGVRGAPPFLLNNEKSFSTMGYPKKIFFRGPFFS